MSKRRLICIILALILTVTGCGSSNVSTSVATVTKNMLEQSTSAFSAESIGSEASVPSSGNESEADSGDAISKPESISAPESQPAAAGTSKETYAASEMTVHFLDVGEGTSTLIESQGHYLLMDGGDRDHSSFVVAYLKQQGVSTLDYVIASHFDDDHINGIVGALHVFTVSEMLEPGYIGTTDVYQSLKNIEKEKSITPIVPKVGDSYTMGSISFQIVGPVNYNHTDENDNSLCVLVTNGTSRFLFTGDAETVSEDEICGTGIDLTADVMEAGHHGSDTSNSEKLLNAVNPKYVVLSCGKDNSYGLPAQDVIERIKSKGISLFRTDEQQTVIATSDGTNIAWSTEPSTTWAYGSETGNDDLWDSTISYNTVGDVSTTANYILNNNPNGKKFHRPDCKYVSKISAKNYAESNKSRDELIAEGYAACKWCRP